MATILDEKSSGWLQSAKAATPENEAITAHIVEIVDAWERGDLPLAGVRTACTGWDRFVASIHAKAKVMPMVDALEVDRMARQGEVMTKHGAFQQRDLIEHGAWIHPDANGRRVIQFKTLDDQDRPYFRVIPDHKLEEGERHD